MHAIRKFGAIAVALVGIWVSQGAADASVVYGLGNNGQIVRVDLANLTESVLYTPSPAQTSGNAVAIDSAGSSLYFRSPASGALYRYDLTDPGATPAVLSVPASPGFATTSNASWYDNSYWAVRDGTNDIYRANFGPGGDVSSIQLINNFNGQPSGTFSFGDIAITTQGRLYGTTSDNRFFRVELAGGIASGYTLINSSVGETLQIALDPTQTFLYAHSNNSGKWWTMDLASGDLTPVMKDGSQFTTTKLRDIAGAVVPEPASIAMASLGGLFGLGLSVRRRRAGRNS